MHPLDAYPLDGFEMVASDEYGVRRPLADVWRLLAVGADEPIGLPAALTHRIIERFGPGEHRCSVLGDHGGRPYCARGFRRVYAGHEVLEVQRVADEEHLVRTTFGSLHFGRTLVTSHAGYRATSGAGVRAGAQQRWTRVLRARRSEAERYLALR